MNINDIDLNLLRVLNAVAEERSVTKAAERLDLSQPAISNALKRLRGVFEDKLLVRGAGGMVLTPRGAEIAARVSEAIRGIETALVGGPDVDPTRIVEPITITCADEEILLHGSDILKAVDRTGCRAPLQFLPLNTEYRSDVLWRKRLAVTITTMLYAPEGLKQRKIYDEKLVCLMRADHPFARNFDLEAYLASDHLLIAPLGGSPSGYLDAFLKKQGWQRRIRMISHSFGSAGALVKDTGLVATLPSRQVQKQIDDGALIAAAVPFDVPTFSLHMFWSDRYENDPLNKWLRNVLLEAITRRTN